MMRYNQGKTIQTAILCMAVLCCGRICLSSSAVPGKPAGVLLFKDLEGALRRFEGSTLNQGLQQSNLARRIGLPRFRHVVQRELRRLGAFLDVDAQGIVSDVAKGRGYLCMSYEAGRLVFLWDIQPAEDVPFALIGERLITRDAQFVWIGERKVAGQTVMAFRADDTELYAYAEPRRCVLSTSTAMLEAGIANRIIPPAEWKTWTARSEECLRLTLWPARFSRVPQMMMLSGLGVRSVTATMALGRQGINLSGDVVFWHDRFLTPFKQCTPQQSAGLRFCPETTLGVLGMQLDWKELYRLLFQLMPSDKKRLSERQLKAFANLFLGGQPLDDMLTGLGPDITLAVSACKDEARPVAFSLLARVGRPETEKALHDLGRKLYGLSALDSQTGEIKNLGEAVLYTGLMDSNPFALGVSKSWVCLSSSVAVCARMMGKGKNGGRDIQPAMVAERIQAGKPAHGFWGIDAQALKKWLAAHGEFLLKRPAQTGRARRKEDIHIAMDVCSLFQYAGGFIRVADNTLNFQLNLDFVKP